MDPQSGTLYIAFTSGFPGNDGSPDRRIFQGPQGETPYDPGWIMKLQDLNNDPSALSFRWEMLALGGSPDQGGTGFSNPDNLEVDAQGNVWVVTDMGSRGLNQGQGNLGRYGNNAAWIIPTQGDRAGEAIPFATGPMECEICGIFMTPDQKTLFLAPQHPGEVNGMRQAGALENREISLSTTTGEPLIQVRSVPLGSNWPGKGTNDPPKPSVVAVRRLDGETIV
jgi:secreted PhoX family phosphatase